MVAVFCLRLACGLIASLPVLKPDVVPPRFFRVHFLTALGLLAVAWFFLPDSTDWRVWSVLAVGALCCFAGSVSWHVDKAPAGRLLIWLTPIVLTAGLVLGGQAARGGDDSPWYVLDDLAAAAVLGAATTAMLMGHSYLISPAMSISPLMRLLALLAVVLAVRITIAGVGLWLWTGRPGAGNLETELLLWLPARWLLGLLGPLALGWMAWETARIRSTQSATGILYVVVIVCFLGELTSQLLLAKTGFLL